MNFSGGGFLNSKFVLLMVFSLQVTTSHYPTTSYKWGYKTYKSPKIHGYITGVITPFIGLNSSHLYLVTGPTKISLRRTKELVEVPGTTAMSRTTPADQG